MKKINIVLAEITIILCKIGIGLGWALIGFLILNTDYLMMSIVGAGIMLFNIMHDTVLIEQNTKNDG